MPEQQVMWTALPRGADSDSLYLDVFVSPRLGIDAAEESYVLSDFPDFEHWPATVAERLTFAVELAGTSHDAEVVPAQLDSAAWDHLFRPSTFVRPWVFRDLCDVPIYSYSVGFVTAYLTALYSDVGGAYPTDPPTPGDLHSLVDALGPLSDVRVDEEREPPARVSVDIPVPRPRPVPEPREGCLAFLYRVLRPFCRPLRWLFGLLRSWLRIPSFWRRPRPIPPAPPRPQTRVPRSVHPSPYGVKAPLRPATIPALDELERRMAADKVIAPSDPVGPMDAALAAQDITFDCARVKRFYEHPETEIPDTARPTVPELDFHQALGALGDYPALLRILGVVIRLRVPRATTEPDTVRVIPLWDGQPQSSDVCPATRTTPGAGGFVAANRPGSELAGGLLDLRGATDHPTTDEPKFAIVQMDTDGSALKAMNMANTIVRRNQLAELGLLGIDTPEHEALPALRSGGLAIVRADRAYYLHQRLCAAKNLSVPRPADVPDYPATLPADLFAEDVLRGYRIEVSTDGGPWLSLCKRIGTYRLVDDAGATVRTLPVIFDEGYVKGASGTRAAGPGTPLYVHEALARWTGWSLTAPRPGKTMENQVEGPPPGESPPEPAEPPPGPAEPPPGPYDRPRLPKSTAVTEFRLVTSFVPQRGTLPRLRFGHSYRFRVPCVDLAGEPIAAPGADPVTSDPVTFRRFEPAGPPAVLPLRSYLPGESLEHVVLRSDFDRDNLEYDQTVWGASEADAVAQRTRHLFPPKTSQQMAELHGRFDIAFGETGDPDAGYRLALRESGTLADPAVIDVHADFDVDTPQATIDAGAPEIVTLAGGEEPVGYGINGTNATVPTPYLPDPLAVGVALRGLPGLVDTVAGDADDVTVVDVPVGATGGPSEPLLLIPFTGEWPDLQPLRIVVAEPGPDDAAPHWDSEHRLLTVYLAKATFAVVRYSCYVGPAGLDIHAIWGLLEGGPTADRLRVQAESGAHWMISPPRTLTLVHAVQRPLKEPRFTALIATRVSLGETGAELKEGVLRDLDVASTSRIDVVGRWDEWLDDEDLGVKQHRREAVACHFTVAGWSDDGAFPPPGRRAYHEFGDTRYRRVRYLVRATSRFREYMQPDADLVRETPLHHEKEVHVLNSARPAAPRVLYAVPTFEWPPPRTPDPETPERRVFERLGGSVRVYLDRPWYVSGEGELLGIVLQANEPNTLPDRMRTRYGADATSGRVRRRHEVKNLEPSHFLNAVDTQSGLSLPGEPGLTATVVAFQPEYDKARKLWYADIGLDLGDLPWNYWPFIRMAFVRYQPNSLEDVPVVRDDGHTALVDVKLSDVVLGEFGQLAPDRTLTLIRDDDATQLTATLRGRAPHTPQPPRVAFRVQTTLVETETPDELDWVWAAGHPDEVDSTFFFELVEPVDQAGDGRMAWETTVDLSDIGAAAHVRLEVAEYELLASDSEFGKGFITRMTYAAHVDLD